MEYGKLKSNHESHVAHLIFKQIQELKEKEKQFDEKL